METLTPKSAVSMITTSYYNYFMPWHCVASLLGLQNKLSGDAADSSLGGKSSGTVMTPEQYRTPSPYFVVLQQQDEIGTSENRKFIVDLSSLATIRSACAKQRSRVALHWGSVTHRLFGIDLDASLLGSPYEKCCARHKNREAAFCSRCWWQLQCAAYTTKLAICSIINASFYNPDLECSGLLSDQPLFRTVITPEDILSTFSGSGGIHLWIHPRVGVHSLSQRQRQQIIDDITYHWSQYVPANYLNALRERRAWIAAPDPAETEPTDTGVLPIDRGASSAGESWRELRLPFSPHLESAAAYVNTPFILEDPTLRSGNPALPKKWAIQWFDADFSRPKNPPPGFTHSSIPVASAAHIKAWRSKNAVNVESAVAAFSKWWHSR